MRYLMGIDGGGSKTKAVVVDESGNRLGLGLSGCGNHQLCGLQTALANMECAIQQALDEAKLKKPDVAFVQYALAGADRPRDFQLLEPALHSMGFGDWNLVCDTMAGLRSGVEDYTGVVLVCGSATNAAGRNRDGKEVQVGGFGYLFGDGTGGIYLAEQAFRHAVRAFEGREMPTILTERVPDFLGFSSMEEMLNAYLDENRNGVPMDLTKVLHEAARDGDGVAISLLQEAGRELGKAGNAVIQKLNGLAGNEEIPVVLIGSVLQQGRSPHLLAALKETMELFSPRIRFVLPDIEPVYGAVLLGMDQLGIRVDMAMMNKFGGIHQAG